MAEPTVNLIPNGDFRQAQRGGDGLLPAHWDVHAPLDALRPTFRRTTREGARTLMIGGNGEADCFGWAATTFSLPAGQTYRLRARFQITPDMNPQQNLAFCIIAPGFNHGLFHFRRQPGLWVEAEERFYVPGEGTLQAEAQIIFRFSPRGKVWVQEMALEPCEPIPPRWVKVACCDGEGDLAHWRRVLRAAGEAHADLTLLPETFAGSDHWETLRGPACALMSEMARRHRMYVAGTVYNENPAIGRRYNAGVLYDRAGAVDGVYYKKHPYTPELYMGVTPGTEVPVFRTDFGTVGMMICYDSWFTDVCELLALKGAEIVLFPCAGYYRSLMPARAADNGVRIVTSCLHRANGGRGVWDTSGADVTNPGADPSRRAGDEITFRNVHEVPELGLLLVELDLSKSPAPANWGGPMRSAPGGRRNRREQKRLLYEELMREQCRWWE